MQGLEIGTSKRKLRIKQVIISIIILLLIGKAWQRIMVEREKNILISQGEVFDINLYGGNPEFYAFNSEIKSYMLNSFSAGLRVTGIVRALGNLGIKLPLVIISSDSGESWEKTQKELLKWSNCSSQKTLYNSSHYIHWTNTEYVVEKIKELIAE